jgi:hypothetical protein
MRLVLNNLEIYDACRPKSKLIFPLIKKEITFLWPIESLVEFEKLYVVLIEPKQDNIYNENVFGISKDTGEILWQIEPISHHAHPDSPFTDISKEMDKVMLFNSDCHLYTVDPATGKILKREFTK